MASSELLAEYAQNLSEAHAGLAGLRDPVGQVLARKALLQAAILDYPDGDMFEGESPTDIGIFRVFPTEAAMDWASPSGDFQVSAGQTYLDFHVPKSDNITVSTANAGYAQIAEYMQSRPEIICIMGVTYRVMALSAKRNQDFNMEELRLPDAVMAYASAFWQRMIPNAKPRQFQAAHIVWQDRETFIRRFGGTESREA